MTHSLHREGLSDDQSNDFVVLLKLARGLNEAGAADKQRRFFRLLMKHNPVNLGIKGSGQMYFDSADKIIKGIKGRNHPHNAVMDDRDALVDFLREIKAADFGLSVVVSGPLKQVRECCQEAGITPHTVNLSLGVWGKTEKLPPAPVREIITMCGHGVIPSRLVSKMAQEVAKGIKTPWEAAIEICRPCVCGLVNPTRVVKILKRINKNEGDGEVC